MRASRTIEMEKGKKRVPARTSCPLQRYHGRHKGSGDNVRQPDKAKGNHNQNQDGLVKHVENTVLHGVLLISIGSIQCEGDNSPANHVEI